LNKYLAALKEQSTALNCNVCTLLYPTRRLLEEGVFSIKTALMTILDEETIDEPLRVLTETITKE